MKKLTILLLVAVFVFTACKKDQQPGPGSGPQVNSDNPILGSWISHEEEQTFEFYFNENGNFYMIVAERKSDDFQAREGRFVTEDDSLRVVFLRIIDYTGGKFNDYEYDSRMEDVVTFTIDGDNLTLEGKVKREYKRTEPSGLWELGREVS